MTQKGAQNVQQLIQKNHTEQTDAKKTCNKIKFQFGYELNEHNKNNIF